MKKKINLSKEVEINRTKKYCNESCYFLSKNNFYCNYFKQKLEYGKIFTGPGEYDMFYIPCQKCNEEFNIKG